MEVIKISYISFIFLSSMIYIISCVSPVTSPIESTRNGTYKSREATFQKRQLTLTVSSGYFTLSYTDTNGTASAGSLSVYSTNISGVDPYYSFQNTRGAGTLNFISDKKVIVTFNELVPDYLKIGETTCIKD